jgi:hypothetical protein
LAEIGDQQWEARGEHLESSLQVRSRDLELLVGPRQLHYGGADIDKGSLRVRVGRRPIAMNLANLYSKRGRAVPDEYMVYEGYNIWLLNHSVGILRERGALDASHVYYEIELADERAIITEVLPQPKFLQAGAGGPRCEAEIRLNGRAAPVEERQGDAAPAGDRRGRRNQPVDSGTERGTFQRRSESDGTSASGQARAAA